MPTSNPEMVGVATANAINKAVNAYERVRSKPWYTRWFWVTLAVIAGIIATVAISQLVNGLHAAKAENRKSRARLLAEAQKSMESDTSRRKSLVAARALTIERTLRDAEEEINDQLIYISDEMERIDAAKNWEELSNAMDDSGPANE